MILLFLASCSMFADHYGAPHDPSDTAPRVITVPTGTSPRSLGPILEEAGVIGSADDFTMYVKLTKEGGCLKAGRHELNPALSATEILGVVCGAPLPEDVPFTVVEGWRIREIDAALAEKGWTQPGEYAAMAANPGQFTAAFPLPEDSLEGYLFPETYMVVPDSWDTAGFVQRQLDLLAERFYTPHQDDFTTRTFDEIVIVASMLEREEPRPANRNLVAGVIWKRLDNNWNLGIDATSHYKLEDWNDRPGLLKALRDPDDPYNTRLRQGLPPTPVGSPSLPSLEAALAPEGSEYWYYLHDAQGNIHPSRNAGEHAALRKKYNVY